jgi:ParB family chromosome partitioning protein
MNTEPSRLVPLALIDVGARLREVDHDYALMIAGSMEAMGQLTPIEVRPMPAGRFELVAGGHRLAAAQRLGWSDIRADIKEATDLEAELRQIDENLVRRELSALDRGTFLARRQQIHLTLYPDTTQGKTGAMVRWHATASLSFASDVATKVGVSERDIRRSIARFTKLAPDVREKIVGTWIADNGVALDALVKIGPGEQRKAITIMLRPDAPVKSVGKALSIANGVKEAAPNVDDAQLAKLMEAWRRSGMKARREFLGWLEGEGELKAFRAGKNAYKDAKGGDEAVADYAANGGQEAA